MLPPKLSDPRSTTNDEVLLQVQPDEATIALTIGATALAGFGLLAKLSGILLSRAASRRQSRYGRYRGRRAAEAEVEEVEIDATLRLLTEMEPEHCFKRIICAAQTGK